MASAIASITISDDRPLATRGCSTLLDTQGNGSVSLRRVQSEPVLSVVPVLLEKTTGARTAEGGACPSFCPALAWADMLELDTLHPDDSGASSGGADLLSIQPMRDARKPPSKVSAAGAHQQAPTPTRTPLRAPFKAVLDTLLPKTSAQSDRVVECTRTRLNIKARPFVAAGAVTAETSVQRSPHACAFGRDGERPCSAWQSDDACNAPETRTTLMMRNVPYMWTREKLLTLLDSKGFATSYDFVYLPIDFETAHSRGYAFVSLADPSHVANFIEKFEGFCDWQCEACKKECHVCWSDTQTLQSNILRYQNSAIMDPSVPDDYKPIILKDGVRIPFPKPTRELRELDQGSGPRKGWRRTPRSVIHAKRDRCV